jgi:hypothetical protein
MGFDKNEIDRLLADCGRRCCICGHLHAVQVHHIKPKEKGGTDDIENGIPLCPNCHDAVHTDYSSGKTTKIYSEQELKLHRHRTIEQIKNTTNPESGSAIPNYHKLKQAFPTTASANKTAFESSVLGSFASANDYKQKSELLLDRLHEDPRVSNILNGSHLPICLPKCEIGDYGRFVEELVIPGVKRSYEKVFPNRRFENRMVGKLHGQLAVEGSSRQGELIERMAAGPVVGIQFPIALQGFSVLAARESIQSFPSGFVLSGVLDTCFTMVAFVEVLATDHSPTLVCAGTAWNADFSLCFHPHANSLSFCVADEGFAIGSFSPGLLYIGS